MKYAGIDIGSRTVKLVVLENGDLVFSRKSITSHNPLETARELMNGAEFVALDGQQHGPVWRELGVLLGADPGQELAGVRGPRGSAL